MNKKLYLVNAGNDQGMSGIANDNSFPALGVLALGTHLKKVMPDLDVLVRDGGAYSQKNILDEIQQHKPGIVGVSVLSTSYKNALEIAQCAKDCGAHTVFGNDQAAQLSKKILENRPQVDFVIGSEYGERSLELLVRSLNGEPISFQDMPDLTFRAGGKVCGFDYARDKGLLSIVKSPLYKSQNRNTALDQFPILDRSLYPAQHWESYLKNYLSKFAALHDEKVTGVTTINRARGCSRASESLKCKHCDMLLDISFSSPEIFWDEVKVAHEQVGANVFYEVCDSLSSFPHFVKRLMEKRPSLSFNPHFFVYAQAVDLVRNPDMIKWFKDLGVFRVNIGLESGSNVTLQHMKGKGDSVDTNYRALQLAKEQGIHVYGSFVLGTDPETPKTLNETVSWVKRIIDEKLIADVEAQPILPLPGNMYGKKLIQSGLLSQEELKSDWPWDIDTLSETYVNNFSGVKYKDAIAAAKEIRAYARKAGLNFGSGASEEKNYK